MSDSSRRGFLKVAGAGAAVAAGVAVIPSGSQAAGAEAKPSLPSSANGALVAHVADVKKGEVTMMVEGHEVTVVDHELVARLATALHKANVKAAKANHTATRSV